MNKSLSRKSLDELVETGVIKSYLYHEIAAEYGMNEHQILTITFPNGERLEVQSRGGCEEASWLVIE